MIHTLKEKNWNGPFSKREQKDAMASMFGRYATSAKILLEAILPHYKKYLEVGRTSYRPVEIAERQSTYRKDDTRLHVNAFPSSPVQGKRILRVFTDINPHDHNRFWRLGESFSKVAERFLPHCPRPNLALLKILEEALGQSLL